MKPHKNSKKKSFVTTQDKSDWTAFTKKMGNISVKEDDFSQENLRINIVKKIDLHGFTLDEANRAVDKFVIESFNKGHKKVLVVTGKGLRSKSRNNPYVSEKLNMLRYSVPEFLKNNQNLNKKIIKVSKADIRDGGEGAIYIFLKNKKKLQNKL